MVIFIYHKQCWALTVCHLQHIHFSLTSTLHPRLLFICVFSSVTSVVSATAELQFADSAVPWAHTHTRDDFFFCWSVMLLLAKLVITYWLPQC